MKLEHLTFSIYLGKLWRWGDCCVRRPKFLLCSFYCRFYSDEEGPKDWSTSRYEHVMKLRQAALQSARDIWADYILVRKEWLLWFFSLSQLDCRFPWALALGHLLLLASCLRWVFSPYGFPAQSYNRWELIRKLWFSCDWHRGV